MLEAIGKELRIIRIRKDLKLEDVAENIGFNKETLRRYEKNATGLSVERLKELLNYYQVDSEIFFENVCEYMHNNQEKEE